MRKLFISLFFLLPMVILASDYNFTITGDLQNEKMHLPKGMYSLKESLDFVPIKGSYVIVPDVSIYKIKEKESIESAEIFYQGGKKYRLIEIKNSVPMRFENKPFFFENTDIFFIYKSEDFNIASSNGNTSPFRLVKRKGIELDEIIYEKKQKGFSLINPQENSIVYFKKSSDVLGRSIDYIPQKQIENQAHHIFVGYRDSKDLFVGYKDASFDLEVSKNLNKVYLSNGTSYAGAVFSPNYVYTEAGLTDFNYIMKLENDMFKLGVKKDNYPFEYGLGIINMYPLPLINWYSGDFGGLLSIGCDFIDDDAYGVNFKLNNKPFSFGISSGYNFNVNAFHLMLSASYNFEQFILRSKIQYFDNFDLLVGFDYFLINSAPWFLKLYGNIGYSDFSTEISESNFFGQNIDLLLGTKINYNNYNLDFNIDYDTGGLKFNVEAGYTF